jgi:hypothetical protein
MNKLGELVAGGQFGVVRKNVVPFNSALMSAEGEQVLKTLRPYLNEKEYQALRISYSIISLEKEQISSIAPDLIGYRAQDMKNDLKVCYPRIGLRFYNLATTGAFEYLAGITPAFKQAHKDMKEQHEAFRESLNNLLGHNRSMVFTNASMSPSDVRKEVKSRLKTGSLETVFVFARGTATVEIVDHVCAGVAREYGLGYQLTQHHYQLGASLASANVFSMKGI